MKSTIFIIFLLTGCSVEVSSVYSCEADTAEKRKEHFIACRAEHGMTIRECQRQSEWLYCTKQKPADKSQ